jgi:hypothetical protein
MSRQSEGTAAAELVFERSQEILDDQPWLSQDQAKDVARRELGVTS